MLRKTQQRKGTENDGILVKKRFFDKVTSKKRPGRSERDVTWLSGRIAFQAEGNTHKKTLKWEHALQVQGTAKSYTCLQQSARRVAGEEPRM